MPARDSGPGTPPSPARRSPSMSMSRAAISRSVTPNSTWRSRLDSASTTRYGLRERASASSLSRSATLRRRAARSARASCGAGREIPRDRPPFFKEGPGRLDPDGVRVLGPDGKLAARGVEDQKPATHRVGEGPAAAGRADRLVHLLAVLVERQEIPTGVDDDVGPCGTERRDLARERLGALLQRAILPLLRAGERRRVGGRALEPQEVHPLNGCEEDEPQDKGTGHEAGRAQPDGL